MAKHILLVDDDIDLLEVFQAGLEIFGHSVIVATDGKKGLKLYEKHTPCIVISDVKMPEMDGYELFSSIHKLNSNAKVILVTGHEDKEKSKIALKNGLIDVLVKPVSMKLLKDILKKHDC